MKNLKPLFIIALACFAISSCNYTGRNSDTNVVDSFQYQKEHRVDMGRLCSHFRTTKNVMYVFVTDPFDCELEWVECFNKDEWTTAQLDSIVSKKNDEYEALKAAIYRNRNIRRAQICGRTRQDMLQNSGIEQKNENGLVVFNVTYYGHLLWNWTNPTEHPERRVKNAHNLIEDRYQQDRKDCFCDEHPIN